MNIIYNKFSFSSRFISLGLKIINYKKNFTNIENTQKYIKKRNNKEYT